MKRSRFEGEKMLNNNFKKILVRLVKQVPRKFIGTDF